MSTKVLGLLLGGLLATAVIAAPFTALAQDASKAEMKSFAAVKSESPDDAKAEAKAKRPLTAQQLKMKDCGAKWQDEKKTKGVKGREAWNKFRSECLKS